MCVGMRGLTRVSAKKLVQTEHRPIDWLTSLGYSSCYCLCSKLYWKRISLVVNMKVLVDSLRL